MPPETPPWPPEALQERVVSCKGSKSQVGCWCFFFLCQVSFLTTFLISSQLRNCFPQLWGPRYLQWRYANRQSFLWWKFTDKSISSQLDWTHKQPTQAASYFCRGTNDYRVLFQQFTNFYYYYLDCFENENEQPQPPPSSESAGRTRARETKCLDPGTFFFVFVVFI